MTVSRNLSNGVGVLTICNDPVNALSHAVRTELFEKVGELSANAKCQMIVITGQGRAFIGGADITEFGKPAQRPSLPEVIAQIENCSVPTIALINGYALGGGLEVALACRYRIAASDALLGLPEVKLGLIPGAGGTQRLPRLIGMDKALDMITTGRSISATDAFKAGLVDQVSDSSEYLENLNRFENFVSENSDSQPMEALSVQPMPEHVYNEKLQAIRKKSRGQISPVRAVEAVYESTQHKLSAGLEIEREIFLNLMHSPQRAALLHIFFAERNARKVRGLKARTSEVKEIGVIGAGTMGSAIAFAFARAGFQVHLIDQDESTLNLAKEKITHFFDRDVATGIIEISQAKTLQKNIGYNSSIETGQNSDLWVEAVSENMTLKKKIFRNLDKIAKPGAILASNTSYLDLNEIAAVTTRPDHVIGMHFFNPAHKMRLLEIIPTARVADSILSTVYKVGKKLGKIGVVAGVCNGFVGNRILKVYRKQSEYMIEDGAFPETVDQAMREFGFPMGPFEMSDLAGLDIGWASRRRDDSSRPSEERYVELADILYDMGRLGQKTSAGWYVYKAGSRKPIVDPVVTKLVRKNSKYKGIKRHDYGTELIQENILLTMINEGAKILEESIVTKPSDIDVVMTHGYGFPKHIGGPMFYADSIGLETILNKLLKRAETDPAFWTPSNLIFDLVSAGRNFSDLNDEGIAAYEE